MELSGARVLGAGATGTLGGARVLGTGATGALGGAITAEPAGRGARAALAGRDRDRPAHTAQVCPGVPTAGFGAYDPGSCARAVHEAAALPGQDVVVAFGSVAFGAAEKNGVEVAVLEIRPGHLGTGFATRPGAGTAPPLPEGGGPRHVVGAVADAPEAGAGLHPGPGKGPVLERRAR
ncbi:hypothetical protein [Streptomyces sp. ML-6]|uniref:hypothetical protein n=1 Tax=Streptomyces sp. ML-6 TaxID=2982693 RepID=UPI0024C0B1B6|nr:hypothetical protein [Streptomyces sp. ML-6]MDK0524115.1 hypothetical protein [Streptomyces sp. ML-6]